MTIILAYVTADRIIFLPKSKNPDQKINCRWERHIAPVCNSILSLTYTLLTLLEGDRYMEQKQRITGVDETTGLWTWQYTTFKFCPESPPEKTSYLLKIGYHFNEKLSDCLENRLLQSDEFKDNKKRDDFLVKYLLQIHPEIRQFWEITKITLHTDETSNVTYTVEPDTSHLPTLVDSRTLPSTTTRIPSDEIADVKNLGGAVWKIKYRGTFFVLKKHLDSRQDRAFPAELEALTSKDLSSPHIVKFMGFTSNDSGGVTGLVSEYCVRGDLRYFLRRHLGWPWEEKLKWAAQICHGLMAIHTRGMTHTDLRCQNVVLDVKYNVKIIDIVNGCGFMSGWAPTSEKERLEDPKWDVYSLGVTLWEIVSDGESPVGKEKLDFGRQVEECEVGRKFKAIVAKCLVDDPEERPRVEEIFLELGGQEICGCS